MVLTISPGYLEAARTQLKAGRDFSWYDTKTTPYVAIVNQTFARKMWGETPAIGQHFIFMDHLREVVGVVGGRQIPRDTGVAPTGGLSAVIAKRAGQRGFRRAIPAPAKEMVPALEHALNSD